LLIFFTSRRGIFLFVPISHSGLDPESSLPSIDEPAAIDDEPAPSVYESMRECRTGFSEERWIPAFAGMNRKIQNGKIIKNLA
jgi:hypothetical protein